VAPAAPPPMGAPPEAPPRRRPPPANADTEGYDPAYASPEDIEAMRDLFGEVEKALIARTQYGPTHPETRRRADRAFKACASGLMRAEYGLVWNVTPYSFSAGDESLWEPEIPLDRIPYQLFADGVRLLGLAPGIDEDEFQRFFQLLTLDRATEVPPEDDFATLIWDADFKHVAHQIVDTFADGDHSQRLRFEQDRDRMVQLAHFDTTEQMVQCWNERQAAPRAATAIAKQRQIATRLGHGPSDAESLARAAELRLATGTTATVDPAALRVDDALRTMLGAKLTMETGGLSERFAAAVARAYEDGVTRDGGGNVTTPVRFAVDGLAEDNPELAIDMVGTLCREVGASRRAEAADRLRAAFAGAIVSKKMVESVLAGVQKEGADRAIYVKGLNTILGYCDETYFAVVLKHLGAMPDADLRDVLIAYLTRTGVGHEAEMGELFATADIELGLCLVRVLASLTTPKAREAIGEAVKSPHPVVRIEALGHVEGVSSERLRLELRTLLEDREAAVRIAALRAMDQYAIRVAGPFLVIRVRSPEFDSLPAEERRQAMVTLGSLAPARAEAVALELAKERRLIASGEHEVSREIAVETLGRLASSDEARVVLGELSTARFRNSDRVRAAAARALEEISARLERAAAPEARSPAQGRSVRS